MWGACSGYVKTAKQLAMFCAEAERDLCSSSGSAYTRPMIALRGQSEIAPFERLRNDPIFVAEDALLTKLEEALLVTVVESLARNHERSEQ